MKTNYECSFELWKDCQPDGRVEAEPTDTKGIWKVTEKVSGDFGFVFCDETENFYPKIFKTVDDAVNGMQNYCLSELSAMSEEIESSESKVNNLC